MRRVLALRAINNDLITPCWDIGRLIVARQHGATWGQSVVAKLAAEIHSEFTGLTRFSAANLWRMRLFYVTYAESERLAPFVREMGWSHNLVKIGEFIGSPRARGELFAARQPGKGPFPSPTVPSLLTVPLVAALGDGGSLDAGATVVYGQWQEGIPRGQPRDEPIHKNDKRGVP